jgi:hypothetical protein
MTPVAVPDTPHLDLPSMNELKSSVSKSSSTTIPPTTSSIRALDTNWSFHQLPSSFSDSAAAQAAVKEGEWLDIERIPTSVHVELLKREKIVDPYKGLGEWDVQVGVLSGVNNVLCLRV